MDSDEEFKPGTTKANLNCRFYRRQFPKIDELVMVEVRNVDQVGAYVSLLEYNNMEGLIMLGELSRKRIRSVSKLTRIGRKEVVIVIRVDESKHYLDLSKKQVTAENISECENKFIKAKAVNNILRHVAQTTETNIEFLYETIGWPLYDKYEHALDAFKMAVYNPDQVFEGLEMTPKIRESLIKAIKNRLTPKDIKVKANFSVTCFEYEGIDAIKAALTAGMNMKIEGVETKIRLIAAPLYVMVLTTHDRNQGINYANIILNKISEEIAARGGNFMVKEAPMILNEGDDQELEEIQKQNINNRVISDIEEDNDEGMGDVDIGIDTAEIDAKNEARDRGEKDDDDDYDEEDKKMS